MQKRLRQNYVQFNVPFLIEHSFSLTTGGEDACRCVGDIRYNMATQLSHGNNQISP